jgi:hypothetical protein
MLLIAHPSLAGKNSGGALAVHVDDEFFIYSFLTACQEFEGEDPGSCEGLRTETDLVDPDEFLVPLVWFLAAVPDGSDPGVTVVRFGIDHNLAPGSLFWEVCGPEGSIEDPDPDWPNDPDAGNSVIFGSPVVGDRLFPFYVLYALGDDGNYIGTTGNPTLGYAGFLSDDDPPVLDETDRFGQMRWFAPGFNDCPAPVRVCCINDECFLLIEEDCLAGGGVWYAEEETCEGFECPPVAIDQSTWGAIRSRFR